MSGKVWLVGAGPGDRGLLTLKGLEVLRAAEVVVYDALVGEEVLTLIPEEAELINVGKRAGNHIMVQEDINRVLLEKAKEGKKVVRLKGGDPFLFGRGGEELELLVENDIPYEVVPGVTSAFAVPAYNGIPVTHRDYTSSVHIITGHKRKGKEYDIDFEALVRTKGTLIFLMGIAALESIMKGLLRAGIAPDKPAAVLQKGTTAGQKRVVATVSTLKDEADKAGIETPAIIVVGDVCGLAEEFFWYEKRPLAGRRILVTRPKDLQSEMSSRLRKMGAEVMELPAIETVPFASNPELERCISGMFGGAEEERCDWLVFTSPTGVKIFMNAFLTDHDVRDLCRTKIAVIGQGSAKALSAYGLRADFIPSIFDGETLGRELAGRIGGESEGNGRKVRILIPRAAIGNQELTKELGSVENAEIYDIATYDTVYTSSPVVDERAYVAGGEIDYAVFTSASTVRGFAAAMEGIDISNIKAVCIGRQTQAAAQSYGMSTRTAPKATMDAVAEAVCEAAAQNW
ncbi:MAG: uroporphyrinogen-III C-methyltransferase [Lachnospiraceae bacterium]|nr:uroporphyrinogen-III C-methyltransferase [Lachnospiraceae bacterium]